MPKYDSSGRPEWEAVHCADGFNMSVQASRYNYCSPRNNTGPWYSVEVGYPSHLDVLLRPYAEEPDRPTDTVYGYVPSEIILAVVEAHGGQVGGELPELILEEKD
tara:strand:- start:4878 stop:5192 length:315 start_codon:yes stop_codon:yes gene_type:complete